MLGVDAALDGVAAHFKLLGKNVVEPFAGSDAQLRLDEVDAGDGFGDRMLHLDAGVHLDEVELAVFVHQELDRARVLIADVGQRQRQRVLPISSRILGVTCSDGASSISF